MLKTAHDAEEFMRTGARVSPSWPGGDLRGRIRCSRLISRPSRQNPLQTGRAIRFNTIDVNRTLEIAKTLNTRPAPPESCGKENLWVRRGRYFIGSPGCVRSSAWIWLFRRPRRAPADRRRDRPRRVACRRIRGPWRA